MSAQSRTNLQATYDRVADEYVRHIYDELQHKPLDRELLDRFANHVRDAGTACDIGCGPGHVARYLFDQGVRICGIDLSGEMIERAKQLNPGIEFRQGNMCALDIPDSFWIGILAFYSIIHIPTAEVVAALSELRRVLCPDGLLLLSFHMGDQPIHLDEWWGQSVNVDFYFYQSAQLATYLQTAGFEIAEIIERAPYPDVEHPSRRAYIFARRPKRCPG